MSRKETALARRATELREAFDRSFAVAPSGEAAPTEAFLAIGVAHDNYAMRLAELSGLYVDKKVVRLPGGSAELLGISSFRGKLAPIYDLRILLGYSVVTVPRWLVLVASRTPVGVAFDRFDGYLRLPREAIAREDGIEGRQQHVTEALHTAGQVRPVVNVVSILEAITIRALHSPLQKE